MSYPTIEDYQKVCLMRGGEISASAIRGAAERDWKAQRTDIADTLKRAGEIDGASHRAVVPELPQPSPRRVKTGAPISRARRREILDELRPAVSAIRARIFGSVTTPCSSIRAAADWCRAQESERETGRSLVAFVKAREAVQAAIERANKEQRYHRLRLEEDGPLHLVFWLDKKRTTATNVLVDWHSDGGRLAAAVAELGAATFLEPHDLVAYVLADTEPPTQASYFAIRAVQIPGTQHYRRQLTLKLDDRDATQAQLREVFRTIRGSVRRRTRVSPRARRLVSAVQAAGGPPRKRFSETFWRNVAPVGGWQANQWRAAAQAYYRATRSRRRS